MASTVASAGILRAIQRSAKRWLGNWWPPTPGTVPLDPVWTKATTALSEGKQWQRALGDGFLQSFKSICPWLDFCRLHFPGGILHTNSENLGWLFGKKQGEVNEIMWHAQVMNSAITAQGRGHPWWVGFLFGCLGWEYSHLLSDHAWLTWPWHMSFSRNAHSVEYKQKKVQPFFQNVFRSLLHTKARHMLYKI